MPQKPKSLTTAADDLLNIIKREKEISFRDAAKKLKIDLKTIEAWATFLEEDGVLSVKYKMTTPYLTLPVLSKASKKKNKIDKMFQETLAEVEAKGEMENTSDLLKTAEERRSEGEFGALERTYDQILAKLKKAIQFTSPKAYMSPQEKAELIEKFSDIERRAKEASALTKTKKFDQANRAYYKINADLQKVLKETKSDYSEAEELKVSHEEGVKKLLNKTYELLEGGKLEEAVANYEKTKRILANFSQQYLQEKSSMQESVIKLNRDIAVYSNKIKAQRMQEGVARINTLIGLSKESITKRKFVIATAYYAEIKKVFERLPKGFAKEKRKLKEEVLKVFEQITREREKRLQSRFGFLSKDVERLLKDANKYLASGDIASSFKAYKSLSEMYSQLPQGFMREKFNLQSRIMMFYSQLSARMEKKAESEMFAQGSQVLRLLERMKMQMDRGRFAEANATYSEINQIFERLPEGFLQKKTELQEKIIALYEKLLEKMDARKSSAFDSAVDVVDGMIKECQDSIKSRNHAKANEIYQKLKLAYTRLPPLDIAKRQQIRNKILVLYRVITLGEQNIQPPGMQAQNPEERKSDIHQKIEALKSHSKARVKMPA